MTRALRAVTPLYVPDSGSVPAAAETLVQATELSRKEFLATARRRIAEEIDKGVPAHALGRLIAEMDRLDIEIRRNAAIDDDEVISVEDEPFDINDI